jgi:hypothetical protein
MVNAPSHTADQIDKLAEYLWQNGLQEASHFLEVAALAVREADKSGRLFIWRGQSDTQLDLLIPLLAMRHRN